MIDTYIAAMAKLVGASSAANSPRGGGGWGGGEGQEEEGGEAVGCWSVFSIWTVTGDVTDI